MTTPRDTSLDRSLLPVDPSSSSTASSSRSLSRQVVLDEDEYTAALSRIIARDFFPSLAHLEANNDYLDALEAEDPRLISKSVRRLTELQGTPTPYISKGDQTPYGGTILDTPHLRAPRKRRRLEEDLSLDEFQARYTSEDNSSFTDILEEENVQRRERWSWAWDAQQRTTELKDKQVEGVQRGLIEASSLPGVRERLQIERPHPIASIENAPNANNESETQEAKETSTLTLAGTGKYGDSDQARVDVLAKPSDTRSASVDGWSFKARNGLMFPPDADQSPYDVAKESAPDTRIVRHNNTRLWLSDPPDANEPEPLTPTRSLVGAAIAGVPYRPSSPQIGGFSLVPNMPSPTAAELGQTGVKQLMTMGQLAATPRVLSSGAEVTQPPGTPFHIQSLSQREVVARKLSTSASRSLKAKAALLNNTPRTTKVKALMEAPSWTPRRMQGNLTPAGRRLLERSVGTNVAGNRRADAMGKLTSWGKTKQAKSDLSQITWTPTSKKSVNM